MAQAFSMVLAVLALAGFVLAYETYTDFKRGTSFLCALGALAVAACSYLEATRPHSGYGNAVGAVIFMLAGGSIIAAFTQLIGREKPIREEWMRFAGLLVAGGLLAAGGYCQFAYVV